MQFKAILPVSALLLLAATTCTAQKPTPTDAIASISAVVSWEDSVISSLDVQASTNPTYSSVFAELTSLWGGVKSELVPVTQAAATNAALSKSLDAYVSQNGAQWSSITAQTSFSLPTDAAGASSYIANLGGQLGQVSLTSAGAAAQATGNARLGLMGAGAVGVLGLAALL